MIVAAFVPFQCGTYIHHSDCDENGLTSSLTFCYNPKPCFLDYSLPAPAKSASKHHISVCTYVAMWSGCPRQTWTYPVMFARICMCFKNKEVQNPRSLNRSQMLFGKLNQPTDLQRSIFPLRGWLPSIEIQKTDKHCQSCGQRCWHQSPGGSRLPPKHL